MVFYQRVLGRALTVILLGSFGLQASGAALSLEQAVSMAQKDDPWLSANRHRQQAIEAMSEAADVLPDPKVSVGVNNLALDSFDFKQEAMTQVKFGVSQQLPRGDSLSIAKQKLQHLGGQYPYQRANRKAEVSVKTAHLWLDAYKAQRSIGLIKQNRALFEQLLDVSQASYSAALGKTRQQDIVRAQLELTRLEDRLVALQQTQLTHWQKLGQFIDINLFARPADRFSEVLLKSEALPDFNLHPVFKALAQQIKAGGSSVELAKQQYKPQWSVNANYGYRADSNEGRSRADLFSVGVSLDIPLYTEQRQDNQVAAAIKNREALKTDKVLMLRGFNARYRAAKVRFEQYNRRQQLYQQKLLPQTSEQAEAALTAYTNDDGDFAEVVRARIDQLNAQIELLGIAVERQKIIIELNYFYITEANGGIL